MASSSLKGERRASEMLFDEINSSKNSLRRRNIQALQRTCDLMEKDGVSITLAEAVRRSGDDGPKYSTVSNQGSTLGEYVRLRITEQTAARPTSAKNTSQSVADFLQDPVLQARVRDLEAVARFAKRENVAMRGLLKNLKHGLDIDQIISLGAGPDGELKLNAESPKQKSAANPELGAAILRLFDHLIGERQYSIYRGRLTINNKAILSPHELSLLRELTTLSEIDWNARFQSEDIV